jgi:hypothetical protein
MVGETSGFFHTHNRRRVWGLLAHTSQAGVLGSVEHNKASNVPREIIGSEMKKN